jgi:hypothetical protein
MSSLSRYKLGIFQEVEDVDAIVRKVNFIISTVAKPSEPIALRMWVNYFWISLRTLLKK